MALVVYNIFLDRYVSIIKEIIDNDRIDSGILIELKVS